MKNTKHDARLYVSLDDCPIQGHSAIYIHIDILYTYMYGTHSK